MLLIINKHELIVKKMTYFKKIPVLMILSIIMTVKVWSAPFVVVTIKPIHSLVCALMKDTGATPTLLMDGLVSPHIYALRPGEASQLEKGGLIIWVGGAYETALKTKMNALRIQGKKIITLMDSDGLTLYHHRQGDLWGTDHNDAHHHHHHEQMVHDNHEIDGHVWLAPHNVRAIVSTITKELCAIDSANTPIYQRNLTLILQRIDDLTQELFQLLSPFKGRQYIVYHDATQYFDHYFGTQAIGSLVAEPDLPPSPQHILNISKILQQTPGLCIFVEPQFDAKLARNLAQDTNTRLNQLDYLGSDLDADENAYFDMMRRFANAMVKGFE